MYEIVGKAVVWGLGVPIATMTVGPLLLVLGMLIAMAVTNRDRKHVVKKPFRADRGIWEIRWARWLRTVSRKHHKISGELALIERIGRGGFLWADDTLRELTDPGYRH